jgi:hypothetical protein
LCYIITNEDSTYQHVEFIMTKLLKFDIAQQEDGARTTFMVNQDEVDGNGVKPGCVPVMSLLFAGALADVSDNVRYQAMKGAWLAARKAIDEENGAG